MELLLGLLLVFMIIAAILAVETKDLLSAIISVGAVGFGLSVAFLLLHAPDVAVTQIVVEIIVLVILIRATISRDLTAVSGDREFFGMVVTVTMVLVIFIMGARLFDLLPALGEPVMRKIPSSPALFYLKECLSKTGAGNVVTAILIDFRAYDTLGEVTILFTALIGVLALLRRQAHKKAERHSPPEE